jgi:hypothetical protein
MARNYSLVARMGDPEKARGQAFAQQVREAKIAFMRQFYGIGDKYARNTWMDAYHTGILRHHSDRPANKEGNRGVRLLSNTMPSTTAFYQDVAKETSLQGSGLDRLLYNHRDEFLAVIS